MKISLWNHQVEGVRRLVAAAPPVGGGCGTAVEPPGPFAPGLGTGGYMLAFEMGCGKTRTTLAAILALQDVQKRTTVDPMRVLVLCPLAVVGVWTQEARTLGISTCAPSGTVADRMADMEEYFAATSPPVEPGIRICILNYDILPRPVAQMALRSTKIDCLVCDESHRTKSPGGATSRFLGRWARAVPWRIALTGTPMPQSPLDIYGQFRWLCPEVYGFRFQDFRAEYCDMIMKPFPKILRYKCLDKLRTLFLTRAMVVKKDDVLDLPPEMDERLASPMGGKGLRIYKQMERNLIADLETGVVTAKNGLVRLLRLQQMTSGYASPDDGAAAVAVDDTKRRLLVDIVTDLAPAEPLVVFCRFVHDLACVHDVAKACSRPCYEISGARKELEPWKAKVALGAGAVLAVQIQSGGLGIDLSAARYSVFFSVGFSLSDYLQARARLHRPGQTKSVTHYHLVCEKTVDEKVYQALVNRKEVVDYVVHGVRELHQGTVDQEELPEVREGISDAYEDQFSSLHTVQEQECEDESVS